MTATDGVLPFNRAEAERETAETKVLVGDVAAKVHRLYVHRAHHALGYGTWAAYVAAEFAGDIGVRQSYNLLHFHALRSEIEAQTGIELPALKEKNLRGMGPEQAANIVADVNKAKENGEDPQKAAKASAKENKPPIKRSPRLPKGSEAAANSNTSPSDSTPEETPDEESTASEALQQDDVENAPEYEETAPPVLLPVRPTFSYDSWMKLTLACSDREGLELMREHAAALFDKVEHEIRVHEANQEQRSA